MKQKTGIGQHERIGKYQILEILGKGAAGQVFKAKQDQIDRIVALKVLFPNIVLTRPEVLDRFQREAQIIARLYHPNIIALFEIGAEEIEGTPLHYYAMEYVVEGKTLADMLKGGMALSFDQKLDFVEQLLDGLRQAHREGVVHRDLKPLNILVDVEMTPKILDFGISKMHDSEDLTQAGMILGSPPYMSPEQARGEEATAKSDIFSFGVMAYELFAGKRPFHATSKKEYILDRQIYPKLPRDKLPRRLVQLDPTFPPALDATIFSMLEADPEARPTAERLHHQLEHFKQELFHLRVERIMLERGQIAPPSHAWKTPLLCSVLLLLAGSILLLLKFG